MPAPTLNAEGAISAGTTGSRTPTIPAHVADDILWLTCMYWGPNTAGTLAVIPTPTDWNIAATVKQGEDGRVSWFWLRATAAGTTVTVDLPTGADTGTDTCFAVTVDVIRGCATTGTPYDAATTGGPHTASNQSTPIVTVSGSERFGLVGVGVMDNTAVTSATGYTAGTNRTTTTGTDATIRNLTQADVSSNIAAATTVIAAPANAGSAYIMLGVAFIPPLADRLPSSLVVPANQAVQRAAVR